MIQVINLSRLCLHKVLSISALTRVYNQRHVSLNVIIIVSNIELKHRIKYEEAEPTVQ